ncbi:hypothetical protein [Paenibacillus sp. MMS18-CY102]|nr:hypothetical protein [Paenibacillus sp. MMS18-CY102]
MSNPMFKQEKRKRREYVPWWAEIAGELAVPVIRLIARIIRGIFN